MRGVRRTLNPSLQNRTGSAVLGLSRVLVHRISQERTFDRYARSPSVLLNSVNFNIRTNALDQGSMTLLEAQQYSIVPGHTSLPK
ncbi:hypothetical protein RRG08_039278 [Elysia crispata]|uniref:Uncharacterized protein n=1 Tax=Elysia crispata TaxID=231223 RepID=A0AAE0Z869_9GAST|nr:hypothetical protein RRG08_039278 [Elysia crispata]